MKIIKWFQERKQRVDQDLYCRGYDYAAGALLRGEKTPLVLNAEQVDYNRNLFDFGMDAAIAKVTELGIVKDDRMW